MLEENLNFPRIIYQTFPVACKGFFVMPDIAFEFDNPTYNPSVIQKLSLLTQFLGIATLQSLVLDKKCKGAWPSMALPMRSDNPSSPSS